MQAEANEILVCRRIMERFPGADLKTVKIGGHNVFQIFFTGKLLISIDNLCVEFHFPTRRRSKLKWIEILEGGPRQIADIILRDLADADFNVLSELGGRLKKSTIRIGRFTFCPKCNEMGEVREILFGMPKEDYNREKYVLGGCCLTDNDPEIQCLACNWVGGKEEIRFTRKKSH